MKIAACALLACSTALGAMPDRKAEEIGRTMMQAMGGEEAWKRAHFVRFDFVVIIHGSEMVKRSHLWDKFNGRCRFEDKAGGGQPAVVLFSNFEQRQGSVYVAGKPLEGAAAAKALNGSYDNFLYDIYWLAMPWKWFDPGVRLKYMGKKKYNGQTFDVVELTFDHVGPTPGDRYEAYVSPTSHLMEHWEYVLQSGQKGSWDWLYTTTQGIKLAGNHVNPEGASIGMGTVQILDKVDDAILTDPGHSLAQLGK